MSVLPSKKGNACTCLLFIRDAAYADTDFFCKVEGNFIMNYLSLKFPRGWGS